MNKISFFKSVLFALTVVLFVSCDKDFNEIGSEIIGEDHFGIYNSDISVVAYNNKFGAVQTNNQPTNALGFYDNPNFGSTKASFVTQLELDDTNPTIGEDPQISSVQLSVPYFSQVEETDSEGNRSYSLDSIYGSGKIKLSVYESSYFLRDLDPATGFQEQQLYYSDQAFTDGAQLLNNAPDPDQNDEFFFDPTEIVTYKLDDDGNQVIDTRSKPGMNLTLDKVFFQSKMFGPTATGNLANNNVFKQYFRGLYFKVDNAASSPTQGSLALMNFRQGTITITYDEGPTADRKTKTLVLNLAGNCVNVLENVDKPSYVAGISNPDPIVGDQKLFLKGGAGSGAIIELFTDAQLAQARSEKWLVNDATLTFTIDRAGMAGSPEPNRIYLYDFDNKRPLVDYYTDVTTAGLAKFNKFVHGGILDTVGGSRRGIRYQIRLTNHIKNIISLDSTNVKLGLVVTESIALTGSGKKKDHQPEPVPSDFVPYGSILNPLGTIIYGSNPAPEDAANKVKLEIYYTKPITN